MGWETEWKYIPSLSIRAVYMSLCVCALKREKDRTSEWHGQISTHNNCRKTASWSQLHIHTEIEKQTKTQMRNIQQLL